MTFDPDGPASPDSGIFGLPHDPESAQVVLIPVPFDATTSYGHGCGRAPAAIARASHQVELLDPQFGKVWERGIVLESQSPEIRDLSVAARELAGPIIERGGAAPADKPAISEIDSACTWMNEFVREHVGRAIGGGKTPGVIGGEHSVAYGAIVEASKNHQELGVLQIDAHMDLRESYEGLEWSHASVMFNVLRDAPSVKRIVQIGIRDYGESERRFAEDSGRRVLAHLDHEWWSALDGGSSFASLAQSAIESLPRRVWVSFDVDGLDPALCPHTGTPVAGGLSFNQASALLRRLADSGKEIVGFDLVEVCPGPREEDEWDANVGARLLYKLCGCATDNR